MLNGETVQSSVDSVYMEEQMKESREEFQTLFNLMPDPVVIVDGKGKFLAINDKVEEMTGFSKQELLGKNFLRTRIVTAKSKAILIKNLAKRMIGMNIEPYEVQVVSKNGQKILVEVNARKIQYEGKQADLVIFRDITERKKAEEAIRQYSEHLEELVEERTREVKRVQEQLLKAERTAAIGELATMVGHDLRNPLQSIENATYYLNKELSRLYPSVAIPQKTMEMLQIINDSVNYADKIIRDLKDFSLTKKPILNKTDVNAIVKDALSQVEAPENVELITELGRLPKIKVDKDMMKRTFLNLALNAIQAMENGGTLKVTTKETERFVEVSFKDTGAGISKENMQKIFTPFFTTKAKGMGMGLPICKKLVESHGGSIRVESKEGKGSTFTVILHIPQENGGENR